MFFKANWRWKSLNKEVVIETGSPKLTQARALRWLKGPEVKGKSNKMVWNNSSALSGPLSNLLRWNKNHCQRCSDIYLLAHWLCEDRKLFQPPLQRTPANQPQPEEEEEENHHRFSVKQRPFVWKMCPTGAWRDQTSEWDGRGQQLQCVWWRQFALIPPTQWKWSAVFMKSGSDRDMLCFCPATKASFHAETCTLTHSLQWEESVGRSERRQPRLFEEKYVFCDFIINAFYPRVHSWLHHLFSSQWCFSSYFCCLFFLYIIFDYLILFASLTWNVFLQV